MSAAQIFLGALALLAATARAEPTASPAALDLEACVRRALAENPDVQDAADASVVARLGRDVPRSEYGLKLVPSLVGGLRGGQRSNQQYQMSARRKFLPLGTEVELGGGTSIFSSVPQVSIPYLTEARLTVAQPLLAGRTSLENREHIDDAERRLETAEHSFETARQELTLGVVRGYFAVVRSEELVAVSEGSLGRLHELGEVARAKLAVGAVSQMDVFRTELQATRVRNALLAERARREAALDALKQLLGLDPALSLAVEGRVAPAPGGGDALERLAAPAVATADEAVAAALERRVEVREARDQATDAERKVLITRRRIWPSVDLFGSYARQGLGDTFTDASRLDRTEWLVGLRSTTPLERTEEEVAAAQAEIQMRTRQRRYRTLQGEVGRQVREAMRGVERARAERALAAEIAEQAEKQVELARFRYERGVTDNFDLVQAESDRAEARSAVVLGAIGEILAQAELRRAGGDLVETIAPGIAARPPSGR